VANPDMGIKRQCLSCNAKFFDLAKDPILCPKCGEIFTPVVLARSPPRRVGRPFSNSNRPFEDQGATAEAKVEEPVESEEVEAEDDGEEKPDLIEHDAA
jgi:uncharacterized protein (TIGR02300 family)